MSESNHVGPNVFADETARGQLVEHGEVVTFRASERTTGDTWWRTSRNRAEGRRLYSRTYRPSRPERRRGARALPRVVQVRVGRRLAGRDLRVERRARERAPVPGDARVTATLFLRPRGRPVRSAHRRRRARTGRRSRRRACGRDHSDTVVPHCDRGYTRSGRTRAAGRPLSRGEP